MAAAAATATSLVRRGMAAFVRHEVAASIELFDQAAAAEPARRPYLWQRGLSLFYAERFAEAAEQFRLDVAVNPDDTEESIWCLLSEARLPGGTARARANLLKVGRDSRPVMRAAYALFSNGNADGAALDALRAAGAPPASAHDFFYASLYVGLFCEAEAEGGGDAAAAPALRDKARDALVAAVESEYARTNDDYMAALARVHARLRGWLPAPAPEL